MPQLFTRAGMSTATSGQGTLTLASALGAVSINTASFQSFSSSGVTDGTVVSYLILDSNGSWEAGLGTYTASGTTLTRSVKFSSNSNTPIVLSGSAQVFINALSSDGGDVLGSTLNPLRGFDAPVNLQLSASSNGALLTVAVKTNTGNDPTVTNPVFIPFRDSTATSGAPVWVTVTSALSINTNATGASLGGPANTGFRFWVVAFNNAGTAVLALINCSSNTAITPLNEGVVQSSTAMSAAATSIGVFYTPNGTTVTSKAFRILGYVEYNSTGLATPGTYVTAPNFVQLMGPGIKKPGDIIQFIRASTTTAGSTSSATYVALTTGQTLSITPTSAANLLRVEVSTSLNPSVVATSTLRLSRGTVAATNLFGSEALANPGGAAVGVGAQLLGWDQPNSTSSVTYAVQGLTSAGTINAPRSGNVQEFNITEYQG